MKLNQLTLVLTFLACVPALAYESPRSIRAQSKQCFQKVVGPQGLEAIQKLMSSPSCTFQISADKNNAYYICGFEAARVVDCTTDQPRLVYVKTSREERTRRVDRTGAALVRFDEEYIPSCKAQFAFPPQKETTTLSPECTVSYTTTGEDPNDREPGLLMRAWNARKKGTFEVMLTLAGLGDENRISKTTSYRGAFTGAAIVTCPKQQILALDCPLNDIKTTNAIKELARARH